MERWTRTEIHAPFTIRTQPGVEIMMTPILIQMKCAVHVVVALQVFPPTLPSSLPPFDPLLIETRTVTAYSVLALGYDDDDNGNDDEITFWEEYGVYGVVILGVGILGYHLLCTAMFERPIQVDSISPCRRLT